MNDNELIYLYCSEKNHHALNFLYEHYQVKSEILIKTILKKFFAIPLEMNDLKTMFYFTLLESIFNFQASKNKSFKNFFYDQLKWGLFGYFKKFINHHHQIINYALKYEDVFGKTDDNYQLIMLQATIDSSNLTRLEQQVCQQKQQGYHNQEIMVNLNLKYKQVDNAWSRAKLKLKSSYQND